MLFLTIGFYFVFLKGHQHPPIPSPHPISQRGPVQR